MSRPRSWCPLPTVKSLVERGAWRITATARASAGILQLDDDDIRDCLLALNESDFHKCDPSLDRPGTWLDVYHPRVAGAPIYLKLSTSQTIAGELVVVVSFRLR